MATRAESRVVEVAGRAVSISNPGKIFFPEVGLTKWDIVEYYLAVAPGALTGVQRRPMALKRFPNGAAGEFFFQKRAPDSRPDWVETATLSFPSGATADEVVIQDAAGLAWLANLGCLDLNPHAIRVGDLEHPDELRIDLDPGPNVDFVQVKDVAREVHAFLAEHGYTSFPKTSGSRGIHIYVRLLPQWGFVDVRRAALALAREVERRVPALATSKWWKEERHGVFLDYNQNAKDKTVASVYSVRPTPDARVSTPFEWNELPLLEPRDFTVKTVPARFLATGGVGERIDEQAFSLEPLLELSRRHEAEGLGDAPWPPHYKKQTGEPKRVQPSRKKRESS